MMKVGVFFFHLSLSPMCAFRAEIQNTGASDSVNFLHCFVNLSY